MHLCPYCGAHPHSGGDTYAFTEGDSVDLAVADLTKQARSAPPELARLYRLIRDRIKLQDRAGKVVERGLRKTYRALIEALRDTLGAAPGETVASKARALALNAATLGELLVAAGLGDLQAEVEAIEEELLQLANETVEASGVRREVSITAIRTAASTFQSGFWGPKIIGPTSEALFQGLQSSITGENLDAVTERLARTMEISVPRAVTEARTQIAVFDRSVVAQSAAEAGAKLFLYVGPIDGITRDFCDALVGHVFTIEQIGRLDNGQMPTSPLYSAGGYNCRHQFTPMTPALVEALGLPMGTDEMVDAANAAARRN